MHNDTETPAHLIGLSEEEINRHVAEVSATKEAMSVPLPGPLKTAFGIPVRMVGKTAVRSPVAIDFAFLQQLDSPLLRQMAEAAKPVELRQPTKFTDQDAYDIVYQFTRNINDVEGVLATGVESFRATTRQVIGRQMNPFVVNRIVEVVGELFAESYITALKYMGSEDGGKDFPAPPAERTMDSAGGSTTSAS
jgi:hypothetical protein